MKKLILSLAVVLALSSAAFANHPSGETDRAAISFKKEFHKASEVSWAQTNNYLQAQFQLDNEVLFAYYDFQGNLVGVVHNILTSSLPENLQKELKKYYSGYWVSELFQVSNDEGSYYYIQLKNADETIVLSTEGTNVWHRYSMPKQKIANL